MIVWMTRVPGVREFLMRKGPYNFSLVLRYVFVTLTPFPLYQPCELWGAAEHSPLARALVTMMATVMVVVMVMMVVHGMFV